MLRPVIKELVHSANGGASSFFDQIEIREDDRASMLRAFGQRSTLYSLVEWLSKPYRHSEKRRYLRKREVPNHAFLARIIHDDSRLSDLFVVDDVGLAFSPNISEEEESEIRSFVKASFVPYFHATRRII